MYITWSIKVSEGNGAIMPGDLLVSSSEKGKAMRCEIQKLEDDWTFEKAYSVMQHNELCRNTAVAKAMTSTSDDGKVLALINLW